MSYPASRYTIDLIEASEYTDALTINDGTDAVMDVSAATFSYELLQGGATVAQPSASFLTDGTDGRVEFLLASALVDNLSGSGTWRLRMMSGTDTVTIAGGAWRWHDVAAGAGVDPPPATRVTRIPYVLSQTSGSHGTGVVTEHSDVTSAGSGIIISAAERTAIGTNTTNNAGVVTVHSDMTDAGSGAVITAAERAELHTDHANRAALDLVSGTNTGDEVASSDTAAGVVELATIAEVDTGTDTVRAVTPAGLAGSALATKVAGIEALADVTDATNVDAAGAVMESDVTAKGQIFVATASSTLTALAVGTDDHVLTADAAEASGVKWAAAAAGGGDFLRIGHDTDTTTRSTTSTSPVLLHTYSPTLVAGRRYRVTALWSHTAGSTAAFSNIRFTHNPTSVGTPGTNLPVGLTPNNVVAARYQATTTRPAQMIVTEVVAVGGAGNDEFELSYLNAAAHTHTVYYSSITVDQVALS